MKNILMIAAMLCASSMALAQTPSESASVSVHSQTVEQFRTSKMPGTEVTTRDGVKLGEISEVLFDKEGVIEKYVISFGGFLGIGRRSVGIPRDVFTHVTARSRVLRLETDLTKEELRAMPEFKYYRPPS